MVGIPEQVRRRLGRNAPYSAAPLRQVEVENPATGQRHPSPITKDVVWVVIRARGEEICRLRIPVAELMGDRPYAPPAKTRGSGEGSARQPLLLR